MRILHVSSATTWRGGERQVFFLMEGLAMEEHVSYLMSPKGSPLSLRCEGLSKGTYEYKPGFFGHLSNLKSIKNICKKENIDLVHAHDSHGHTLIWLAYKTGLLSTESIVTRRLNNAIKNKSINKYNDSRISNIICISEAVKYTMSPQIQNMSRLVTIHSAIDLKNISVKERTLDPSQFVIGYVAAFTKEKDHAFFIDIALRLIKRDERYHFVLVGEGQEREEIERRVHGLRDRFSFTGFVHDVDEQYERMDLLLHTAKSEALGTAILDGMKFGLPIVARDVGGVPEIVVNGENGFISTNDDKKEMVEFIRKVSEDGHLYQNMSTSSLQRVVLFDRSIMVNKTIALYQNILGM